MQSVASLLLWIEKGKRTREQAEKAGRNRTPQWQIGQKEGLFTIQQDGRLTLTDKGAAELEIMRTQA